MIIPARRAVTNVKTTIAQESKMEFAITFVSKPLSVVFFSITTIPGTVITGMNLL